MRHVAWILLGLMGLIFWTSAMSRLSLGHLVPDVPILIVAYLTLRRDLPTLISTAVVLGYCLDRWSLAPVGAHMTAFSALSVIAYFFVAQFSGGGALFFGLYAGVFAISFQVLLAMVLWLAGYGVGFASGAAALFLPNAFIVFLLAVLSFRVLEWVDKGLQPPEHQTIRWH